MRNACSLPSVRWPRRPSLACRALLFPATRRASALVNLAFGLTASANDETNEKLQTRHPQSGVSQWIMHQYVGNRMAGKPLQKIRDVNRPRSFRQVFGRPGSRVYAQPSMWGQATRAWLMRNKTPDFFQQVRRPCPTGWPSTLERCSFLRRRSTTTEKPTCSTARQSSGTTWTPAAGARSSLLWPLPRTPSSTVRSRASRVSSPSSWSTPSANPHLSGFSEHTNLSTASILIHANGVVDAYSKVMYTREIEMDRNLRRFPHICRSNSHPQLRRGWRGALTNLRFLRRGTAPEKPEVFGRAKGACREDRQLVGV